MYFDELDLGDDILDALEMMHFEECTPIQERAIPVALEGHDLIAVAQTGTGKTAAYLLPVIDKLSYGDYPTDAINCVVMAPTRELAQQIDRQMEGFAYFLPVNSLAIYGGTDGVTFGRQERALRMGADVVIATPGRLLAHMQMGYVDLSRVSFFILDEADRMLDMGFYDDIMQIATQLPSSCQTLMFSATMPPKIKQLAKKVLKNPKEVKIAVSKPAEKIDQSIFECDESAKTAVLRHLFSQGNDKRVIIFASSKLKVKDVSRELKRAGVHVGEMHSDLDQEQRDSVMLGFRSGRIDILVATDIVARGIDIDDIAMVVNYDVPHEAEDYVHRIGRTARAGAGGKAVTLVSGRDRRKWMEIERFLGTRLRRDTLPGTAIGKGGGDKQVSRDKTGDKEKNNSRNRPTASGKALNSRAKDKSVSTPQSEAVAEVQAKPSSPDDKKPAKRKRRYYGKGTPHRSHKPKTDSPVKE